MGLKNRFINQKKIATVLGRSKIPDTYRSHEELTQGTEDVRIDVQMQRKPQVKYFEENRFHVETHCDKDSGEQESVEDHHVIEWSIDPVCQVYIPLVQQENPLPIFNTGTPLNLPINYRTLGH